MDWTMVSNAHGLRHRVETVLYLWRCRYGVDAGAVARRMQAEPEENELCAETIRNIREELARPSGELGMRHTSFDRDTEARAFLADVLAAYDAAIV